MTLPPRLEDAFGVAAGELGHVSASWLFLREIVREWPQGAHAVRDALGRSFPVVDAVAEQVEAGRTGPTLDLLPVTAALAGCRRVVVVGLETLFLDPLVAALPGVEVALLAHSSLEADFERVLANYRGRVKRVDLSRFQSWAGPKSALLTFAYGTAGTLTHVAPEWLRVLAPDTRTQFRALVGWEVVQGPMHVFPRWLERFEVDGFTHLV